MVTQFGMSDALGPMAVGEQEHEIFLGRELSQRREVSDKTAELVDSEIRRILDVAYSRAASVVKENRGLLDSIAEALLDRETLDADDIKLLAAGEALPPLPEDIVAPVPPALPPEDSTPASDRPVEGAGGEPSPALA